MKVGELYWIVSCKERKIMERGGKAVCKFKPDEPFYPEICIKCKHKKVWVGKIVEDRAMRIYA